MEPKYFVICFTLTIIFLVPCLSYPVDESEPETVADIPSDKSKDFGKMDELQPPTEEEKTYDAEVSDMTNSQKGLSEDSEGNPNTKGKRGAGLWGFLGGLAAGVAVDKMFFNDDNNYQYRR